MAKKVYEEANIAAIAEKIREKTGGEETYTTAEMASGVEEVYEAGRQAEWSDMWDNIQDYGKRTNYSNWFAAPSWNDVTFKPKYLMQLTNGRGMFDNSNIINAAYTNLLDFSKLSGAEMLFANAKIAKLKVVDFRNIYCEGYNLYRAFPQSLEYIDEFYPPAKQTMDLEDLFKYNNKITHVKFCSEINKSGMALTNAAFDKESLDSIMYWLSTTTEGLSVTLPLAAVNKAYETSEGANDGSTSEEWTNKVAEKSNWTINLI